MSIASEFWFLSVPNIYIQSLDINSHKGKLKDVLKKALGIVIIFLFVGAGVLPSISGSTVDDNTTDQKNYTASKMNWIVYIGKIKDKVFHRFDRVEFTGLTVFYIHHLWGEPLSSGVLHDVYVAYDVHVKIGVLTRHFVCALFFVE